MICIAPTYGKNQGACLARVYSEFCQSTLRKIIAKICPVNEHCSVYKKWMNGFAILPTVPILINLTWNIEQSVCRTVNQRLTHTYKLAGYTWASSQVYLAVIYVLERISLCWRCTSELPAISNLHELKKIFNTKVRKPYNKNMSVYYARLLTSLSFYNKLLTIIIFLDVWTSVIGGLGQYTWSWCDDVVWLGAYGIR